MSSRQPAIAPDVLKLFAERNAGAVDVPVLQPADPFLDMAGEDLRRRIFLTESETGQALCLRPEFTIPVCLDHIASQAGTPRRYSYLGEVFRQRREGLNEFFQAGIEDLGDPDTAAADARLLADAHALLKLALPGRPLAVTIGDQAIFEAVLAALGLPRGWRMRLARAFGSADLLASALGELKNPSRSEALPEPAASLVAEGDHQRLVAHVAAGLEEAGLPHSVGRTPEDIARRLVEKAELRSVKLPREAFRALKTFLAIHVRLDDASETLEAFAREAGLTMAPALESFAARVAAIKANGLPADAIYYDAAFGRPLDYYTGLVFEISDGQGQRPLAGGGRYDRLLTLLGAKEPIPGVGFSVWLDRIEHLRDSAREAAIEQPATIAEARAVPIVEVDVAEPTEARVEAAHEIEINEQPASPPEPAPEVVVTGEPVSAPEPALEVEVTEQPASARETAPEVIVTREPVLASEPALEVEVTEQPASPPEPVPEVEISHEPAGVPEPGRAVDVVEQPADATEPVPVVANEQPRGSAE